MRLLLELSNFVTNYTKILCFLQCNLLFYSFVLFVLLFNTWLLCVYCNPGTSLRGHSGEWDDKRPGILMGPQKTNIFKWWWRRVDAVCFRLDALDGFNGEVMSEPRPEDRKGIGWVKIGRFSSAKRLGAEIQWLWSMESFIYATTNTSLVSVFLFPAPLVWVLEWGRGGAEYCWLSSDTEYAWEINVCHLKPLTFEGYLLLQHNWAHPDWYTFQGHTEAENFIHLVFQYMFM